MPSSRRMRVAGLLATAALLTACGPYPTDTAGTVERASGGELRVGVTHNPPWVDTSAAGDPTGREVDLLEGYAASIDAEIEWTEGSEGVLADLLHEGTLDVAIGGYTDDTPWTDKAAVSAPYVEVTDGGAPEKHVVLARAGENRLLVSLETFLRESVER